jgi:DNA repair protein RecN (Recombination protein N)
MLRSLTIQNFVLIDHCQMEFSQGLCVLTGETGAGKSILLGALGLVLGERVQGQPMRNPEKAAMICAEFDSHPTLEAMLEEAGILAEEDTLLIKRMVQPGGKSRCLVNDQPVSLALLKHMGPYLIEIHGQHGQSTLTDPAQQRDILDSFAGLQLEKELVSKAYHQWQQAKSALEALQETIAQAQREEDYLRHIYGELRELNPQPGEETELAESRSQLMQAEKLGSLLKDAQSELQGNGRPVSTALYNAQRLLMKSDLAHQDPLQKTIDMLERAQLELAEAEQGLDEAMEHFGADPTRLEQMEERLFALRGAARKHQCTVEELPDFLKRTADKLKSLDSQTEQLAALQATASQTRAAYLAQAEALSARRAACCENLAEQVMAELKPLKMEATRLQVAQQRREEAQWGPSGIDHIRFEVSTNPGSPFGPLHKIASGGELSRFMLALKVVQAQEKTSTTLIFDEIDTGTSGRVADAIGARLARLGAQQQVMVITHLPQVAGKGTDHFKVAKSQGAGSTITTVTKLQGHERHEELAQMLSGKEITEEARKVASQLMQSA